MACHLARRFAEGAVCRRKRRQRQGERVHERQRYRVSGGAAGGLAKAAGVQSCGGVHGEDDDPGGRQLAREGGEPIPAGLPLGEQWRRALSNLIAVVRAAGADISNIVFLRAFVTDMAEFNAGGAEVGEAWMATLGRHFPAMTLVAVTALVDPNARVEIEAEAVLP